MNLLLYNEGVWLAFVFSTACFPLNQMWLTRFNIFHWMLVRKSECCWRRLFFSICQTMQRLFLPLAFTEQRPFSKISSDVCASSLPSCILPLENSSFIPLLFDKPVFFVLCSIFPSFLCFTRRERSTPCDTCFCTVVDRSVKVSLHFKRPQRAFFFFYMLKAPLGVVLKLNTKKYHRLDCSLAENGYRWYDAKGCRWVVLLPLHFYSTPTHDIYILCEAADAHRQKTSRCHSATVLSNLFLQT